MQDTFAKNTGEKLTIGIVVLVVIVGLGAFGALHAISNLGESSYTGVAGDRLDVLASDDATKGLFPKGTTTSTDRAGSCDGDTSPRFVRQMSSGESLFTIFAFYAQELPRRGWVEKENASSGKAHLVFTKEFEVGEGGPWTGEVEVTARDLGQGRTGYTVVATADPDGCSVGG